MTMNPVIPDPTLPVAADPGVLQSIGGISLPDDVREFTGVHNLWHSLAATVDLARSCYPMIEAMSFCLSHDPEDGAMAIVLCICVKSDVEQTLKAGRKFGMLWAQRVPTPERAMIQLLDFIV